MTPPFIGARALTFYQPKGTTSARPLHHQPLSSHVTDSSVAEEGALMPLDPAMFILTNALGIKKGDRVRYRTGGLISPSVEGEGTVTLIWMGIEEVVDVETDDGAKVNLYPYRDDIEDAGAHDVATDGPGHESVPTGGTE